MDRLLVGNPYHYDKFSHKFADMALTREEFVERWHQLPEFQSNHIIETAWRRYKQTQSSTHMTELESNDPDSQTLAHEFQELIENEDISGSMSTYKLLTLNANSIPWTPTDVFVSPDQEVTVFASGRVWRSRLLDMYFNSQYALWYKVGLSGTVFNSTGLSNTFRPELEGELYVSNQFPGQFATPMGGRLFGPLRAHEQAQGKFELLIVVWQPGVSARDALSQIPDPNAMLVDELVRIEQEESTLVPPGWDYLWFLGKSTIYSSTEYEGEQCIRCKPYHNVGILQKEIQPMEFNGATVVSWDWIINYLPSSLREDTNFTHDYLSVAFEFENGRDITYTWSWELPVEYGYWCPFANWEDREYHVVIRSGTEELGSWLHEERNLYEDYVNYIEEGVEDLERMPKQLVKVWLIAGNGLQRREGEMTVKGINIANGGEGVVSVL
jgi:hypothetical protein